MFVVGDVEPTQGPARAEGTLVALRIALGVAVSVIWAMFMVALLALGSCDAFGGRCDHARVGQNDSIPSHTC